MDGQDSLEITRYQLLESRLDGTEFLQLESVLRHLPGRRISGRALVDGEPSFVKIFVNPRRAARHQKREYRGSERLRRARIEAVLPHKALDLASGAKALVYPWHDADNLTETLKNADPSAQELLVLELFDLLGRLHAAGLRHADLHTSNVLVQTDGLRLLDLGAVRTLPRLFRRTRIRQDVAALLARLNPRLDALFNEALLRHGHLVGWDHPPTMIRLERDRHRSADMQKFREKVLRACSRCEALTPDLIVRRGLDRKLIDRCLTAAESSTPGSLKERITARRGPEAQVWWQDLHQLARMGIQGPEPILLRRRRDGSVLAVARHEEAEDHPPDPSAIAGLLDQIVYSGVAITPENGTVTGHGARAFWIPRSPLRWEPPRHEGRPGAGAVRHVLKVLDRGAIRRQVVRAWRMDRRRSANQAW